MYLLLVTFPKPSLLKKLPFEFHFTFLYLWLNWSFFTIFTNKQETNSHIAPHWWSPCGLHWVLREDNLVEMFQRDEVWDFSIIAATPCESHQLWAHSTHSAHVSPVWRPVNNWTVSVSSAEYQGWIEEDGGRHWCSARSRLETGVRVWRLYYIYIVTV